MVGIVYIQDIRYCPYLDRYTAILQREGIAYECIWWERWDAPPDTPLPPQALAADARHVYRKPSKMARSPLSKAADFAGFARYARQIIKRRGYDRLIILTTMTGMLLGDLLTGPYRGRYIFDIRDFSYENLAPFRHVEAKIIDAADFVCISSEGFLEFLPKGRAYVIADNYVDSDVKAAKNISFRKKSKGDVLILSYIGFVRYFNQNKKILDVLLADDRFHLCYHGAGADADKLLAYAGEHPSQRLTITGYFDYQRDKRALCEQADILNNFYPHTLEIQRLATTNKTYDGIVYKRPQLVSSGTFSQTLVERWRVGCALSIDAPGFADALYDYYHGLDADAFNEDAEKALAEVVRRDSMYRKRIYGFLTGTDDREEGDTP